MIHKRKMLQQGFSLVELSVVIVIIGLIVSGVVVSQQLVTHSKIQAQIADFRKYEMAYKSFKDQFKAIPGDFNKAQTFWGVAAKNGDGDFKIEGGLDSWDAPSEVLIFFQHLSSAGMLNKKYEHVFQLGAGYPALKLNAKKGMTAGGHFNDFGATDDFGYQVTEEARYTAILHLQAGQTSLTGSPNYIRRQYNNYVGTSSPKIYYQIDKKIDDGVARKGIFKSYRAWSAHYPYEGPCLDGLDGDYLVDSEKELCHSYYILDE